MMTAFLLCSWKLYLFISLNCCWVTTCAGNEVMASCELYASGPVASYFRWKMGHSLLEGTHLECLVLFMKFGY